MTFRLKAMAALGAAAGILACAGAACGSVSQTTPTAEQLRGPAHLQNDYARIAVRYPGVYRVHGRDLAGGGVDLATVRPSRIGLWNEGQPVPVQVHAAGPSLGPDDYIEFVGDLPRGTFSTFKPLNLRNIYHLSWSADAPVQYTTATLPAPAGGGPSWFLCQMHLERDLLLRYVKTGPGVTDYYYWVGQTANAKGMYPVSVSFPGFETAAGLPGRIALRVMGMSDVAAVRPGHLFDIKWAGETLGQLQFDGVRYLDSAVTVPAALATRHAAARLLLESPAGRGDVVDSISLDWVRLTYPRKLDARGSQLFQFSNDFAGTTAPASFTVAGLPGGAQVFAPDMGRVFLPGTTGATAITVAAGDSPTSYTAAGPLGWYTPDSVQCVIKPDVLGDVPHDTEAVIVHHPRTAQAARVLAAYRNHEGLKTISTDVTRVFDTLGNGFISDETLKAYLRHVAQEAPGLRYIVLFGDSTNDYREMNYDEREFGTVEHLYPEEIIIPIHWVYQPSTTYSFGYPEDNWYGSFHWDNAPDVAVGRIPANNNAEGMAYVRKVIEYEQLAKSRDDKLLLISSVEASFQSLVDQTRTALQDMFTTAVTLLPETAQAEKEVARIRDAISEGTQLIYYVGHGGAYVWRVGPVDFRAQKDLFTPADVALLTNAGRYPLVVCSSCYVTSFDNRYSLGEAFLMQPDAGAITVIGTPWKTGVYENHQFSTLLLNGYKDMANERLGDVFIGAKKQNRPRTPEQVDFQTFTMLGDPCLKLVRREK